MARKKGSSRRATGGLLTDDYIRNQNDVGIYPDGQIPGYVLRVTQTLKSLDMRFNVRRKGNVEYPTNKLIGHWGDPKSDSRLMTADDGRAKARLYHDRYSKGLPLDEVDPSSMTLDEGKDLYLKDMKVRNCTARSIEFVEQGVARLTATTRVMTLRKLSEDRDILFDEWARIKEKYPTAADATARVCRSIYRFIKGDRDTTLPDMLPTKRIPLGTIKGEDEDDEPYLMPEEIPVWNAKRLALKDDVRKEFWLFSYLSGMRRGVMGGDRKNKRPALRWDMWDRKKNVLTVTIKGNKPFPLVLSKPMVECLERAREAGERLYPHAAAEWVFPNAGQQRKTAHCNGDEEDIRMPLAMLDGEECTIATHVLRRTYTTNNGLLEEVSKIRMLGHSQGKLLRRYDKLLGQIEETRVLQEQASTKLVSLLGPLGVDGSKPVSVKRRGKTDGSSRRISQVASA